MLDLSNLKICYLAGTLGQGGAERQLFYAVQALRQSGATVQVLSLEPAGFWDAPIRQLGVAVSWVGQNRSRFKRVVRIVKHLRRQPPDILQSQHFYSNAYASLAAFCLKCKGIGALRSNGQFEFAECGRLGGRMNLHLPTLLAANSQSSIQYAIKHHVARSRLFFLPNVVDTEKFKPACDHSQGPITLLSVGRLTREKRFDRFISLVHQLRSTRGLDVRGWIVGPTRADQQLRPVLERQAAALGLLPHHLRFLGSMGDLSAIYQQAAIFVLTSEHEGTPNVVLEAMATGLPVVATNVGGIPDIIHHRNTGFLLAQEDTRAQLDALCELVQNPQLRAEMGARARAFVQETHSVQRLPGQLAALYQLALERRPAHQNLTPSQNLCSTNSHSEANPSFCLPRT